MTDLAGVVPPVATPFTPDGDVDTASLERLCAFLLEAGVHGLFAGGSTGEIAMLTDLQRDSVVRTVVGVAAGQVPVIAGVVDTGTARVIDHARRAEALGADAVVATAPFYVQTHPDEVTAHFRLVHDAVGVPVIAYDIPGAVHSRLPETSVAELAGSRVIAALKDSSGDLAAFRRVLRLTAGTGLRVFTGSELFSDVALALGAHGAVPGLGNVDPHGYVRLTAAALGDEREVAFAEQERLAELFEIVAVADRSRVGATAAALGAFKTALHLRGVIDHPATAAPFSPLDAGEVARVRDLLIKAGLEVVR
ncbi:dihydrodipicolinate synthase family protein [Phytomonospora endophytica]|uniref:4-hydroxy-tetrahydrodipicolinate synthase n=1 Tax=Phytomonospora endophytica TaxID=714109 RepID=A0A841FQ15_9ACTN|nr:dihydrodipicolinate synthase family protein [Phytomonospora endophytica]MBB6035888.1 4-hydroxy-tetrahydrodipicolinate synthase [Phytomonospora endophytica]GIG71116.1 dihydrodipicolinate synthase family protein [Phytomonospora endophytica]